MNRNPRSRALPTLVTLGCALMCAVAAAGEPCPGAPLSGPWNFEAGKMSHEGQFTPMGGGKVSAQLTVHDCGARIDATIETVGSLSFKRIEGIRYSADRLPPTFSKGIHWDLKVSSPTQLTSIVYIDEPSEHSQAHMWTFGGDPGKKSGGTRGEAPGSGERDAQAAAATGGSISPPDKLKITQGLWGYVTPGEEIGWFSGDQAGEGSVSPTVCTPPDEDGFYQLPFEPGEEGWFCMIEPPCREAKQTSDCVHWRAVEGIKYCGLDGTNWDC